MAGHSQFKNIMHRKKAVDAKRSRAFSKHARLIMTAARTGGADPATNLALRYAIDGAREENMTNEAIERAIRNGVDRAKGSELETLTYEGYGPGGVAILIDALTDNRARTFGEVRMAVEHDGGTLGAAGTVSWNFERRALFVVAAPRRAGGGRARGRAGRRGRRLHAPSRAASRSPPIPARFAQVKAALDRRRLQARQERDRLGAQDHRASSPTSRWSRLCALLLDALDELEDVQATATNLEWTDAALAAAESVSRDASDFLLEPGRPDRPMMPAHEPPHHRTRADGRDTRS